MFIANIANINKALAIKQITDLQVKLLDWAIKHLVVFNQKKAEVLLPLYRAGTDHSIELKKDTGRKEKEIL